MFSFFLHFFSKKSTRLLVTITLMLWFFFVLFQLFLQLSFYIFAGEEVGALACDGTVHYALFLNAPVAEGLEMAKPMGEISEVSGTIDVQHNPPVRRWSAFIIDHRDLNEEFFANLEKNPIVLKDGEQLYIRMYNSSLLKVDDKI